MHIEISFEVWQALTQLRQGESDSYDDALRRVLKLGAVESFGAETDAPLEAEGGYSSAGRLLPNGTKLRALYKGAVYQASIRQGGIVRPDGSQHRSLSAAARSITGNTVNGLRFWKAKRPGDTEWIIVTDLPKLQ